MQYPEGDLVHKPIINSIIGKLISETGRKYFLIKGPSGSGKTFIVNGIAEYWINLSQDSAFLFLDGDECSSEKDYYPFIKALSNYKKRSSKDTVKKSIPEAVRSLPIGGDLASFLIETMHNSKKIRKTEAIRYLSEIEQLILFDLEKLFSEKELLIIVDNLQWWDEFSVKLLQSLIEGKFNSDFSGFKSIKFICTLTEDQVPLFPDALIRLLASVNFDVISLTLINKESYPLVLKAFGYAGDFSEKFIETLFSLTGGHLTLIRSIADFLSEGNDISKLELPENKQISDIYIENIFKYRLKALGASESQVVSVLEYASVIGMTFTKREIACITKEDDENLLRAIENAKRLYLIDDRNSERQFAHSIIREFFLTRIADKKSAYSKAFLKCLAQLRPYDYFTRAKYAEQSGDLEQATIFYMLGELQNIRNGNPNSPEVIRKISALSTEFDFGIFYLELRKSVKNYLDGKFDLAISGLKALENTAPESLIAEKYYLLALCLSKSMQASTVRQAIVGLDDWGHLKIDESEIWFRVMSTKMALYTHLSNFEEATRIEKELMVFLSDRTKFDPSAMHHINTMRRKSASLHISEIALERTTKSVDFFRNNSSSNSLPSPVQFYMALNNHSGNLLVNSDPQNGFSYAGEALKLIKESPNISFPKTYMPGNNWILNGLTSAIIYFEDAIHMYDAIIDAAETAGDYYLMRNNRAAMCGQNHRLNVADKELKFVCDSVVPDVELDLFYKYFPVSNLAVTKYLLNDKDAALHYQQQAEKFIPVIPDMLYLKKRNEVLREIFEHHHLKTFDKMKLHIQEKHPFAVGNNWSFYSQPFLLTDLQFWSES